MDLDATASQFALAVNNNPLEGLRTSRSSSFGHRAIPPPAADATSPPQSCPRRPPQSDGQKDNHLNNHIEQIASSAEGVGLHIVEACRYPVPTPRQSRHRYHNWHEPAALLEHQHRSRRGTLLRSDDARFSGVPSGASRPAPSDGFSSGQDHARATHSLKDPLQGSDLCHTRSLRQLVGSNSRSLRAWSAGTTSPCHRSHFISGTRGHARIDLTPCLGRVRSRSPPTDTFPRRGREPRQGPHKKSQRKRQFAWGSSVLLHRMGFSSTPTYKPFLGRRRSTRTLRLASTRREQQPWFWQLRWL